MYHTELTKELIDEAHSFRMKLMRRICISFLMCLLMAGLVYTKEDAKMDEGYVFCNSCKEKRQPWQRCWISYRYQRFHSLDNYDMRKSFRMGREPTDTWLRYCGTAARFFCRLSPQLSGRSSQRCLESLHRMVQGKPREIVPAMTN
jgi:hypothetical protein